MRYNICIVTTMSSSIDNWIKPFLDSYNLNKINVTIACNMTDDYRNKLLNDFPFVKGVNIEMPRGASVFGSIKATMQLVKLFKKEKFDLVQYSTPNASFYSAIASYLVKVPHRLYCQWGMVFVSQTGIKKRIYYNIEKTTCKLSNVIQPDSYGNLDFCHKLGLYEPQKSEVIWNGSAKGINLDKFDISKKNSFRLLIREKYNIKADDIVVGFVGRLGRDKGCNELIKAFKILEQDHKNIKLLFVGPIEKESTIEPDLLEYFFRNENIVVTDRVTDVERHMASMDIFILPSYREGFGMSVVEAEAMGVPVIVTNIPGPTNAMIDGKTGLIIPVKDIDNIVIAVEKLLGDKDMISEMGNEGVKFARNNFDDKIFKHKLIENRIKILSK